MTDFGDPWFIRRGKLVRWIDLSPDEQGEIRDAWAEEDEEMLVDDL